jgi:NAD(P)H-dependent FMN reductase
MNSIPRHIIAICGSLRRHSSNKLILQAAARLAQKEFPSQIKITIYENLAELPHFNPDLEEQGLPTPVLEFRRLLANADGVIISSPEYAHGIPGSLKNALDWLVADPAFEGKRICLLNAAIGEAEYAQPQLIEILRTMSAVMLYSKAFPGATVRKSIDADGNATSGSVQSSLREALATFLSN